MTAYRGVEEGQPCRRSRCGRPVKGDVPLVVQVADLALHIALS